MARKLSMKYAGAIYHTLPARRERDYVGQVW